VSSLLDWGDDPDEIEARGEVETETEEPATETTEPDEGGEEEAEEPEDEEEEPEPEPEEEPEEGEAEEGEEGEEGEPTVEYETDDPEVLAWLKRYQGDVDRALKGAVALQRAMGRQGQEKAVLNRRVQELERQLGQAQAFSGSQPFLTEDQRAWVETAADSGNPIAFVRAAVDEGEFELARAVCHAWARDDSFSAMRAAQAIDAAEFNASTAQIEQQTLETPKLLEILAEHYPDLPQYQQKMADLIEQMGPAHPLVEDARSPDPQTAARGIVGIYEVARASSTTITSAREQVRKHQRANGDAARAKARVSSAGASPSPGETPRPVALMPGLTLEQLDAEWARD